MHDKPQPDSGPAFALPDHTVVELSGRDAASFAQAQFMSDVAALATGNWHWSGWLTPKGRVVGLFAVLKLADECLWLLLPDTSPTTLASALQRYVFRSKLTIRVRDDLQASGRFASPQTAIGGNIAGQPETGIELDLGGAGGARTIRISGEMTAMSESNLARWRAFDLEHGLPRLSDTQIERWTPQQLSLERLQAFSIKKGCYPGQEIVARTHFLGKAKRGLALFEISAAVEVGSEVRDGERVLGTVVSATDALALAVLPLDRESGPAHIDGTQLREQPLREGLAR